MSLAVKSIPTLLTQIQVGIIFDIAMKSSTQISMTQVSTLRGLYQYGIYVSIKYI